MEDVSGDFKKEGVQILVSIIPDTGEGHRGAEIRRRSLDDISKRGDIGDPTVLPSIHLDSIVDGPTCSIST